MEEDSSTVKVKSDQGHPQVYEEDFYDSYHAFTAYDSDLKETINKDQFLQSSHAVPSALSELDFSLPSTDLDDLETRIFGKVESKKTHTRFRHHHFEHSTKVALKGYSAKQLQRKETENKGKSDSKPCLHTGDSDPEDHVFHPEIVPFEPAKETAKQGTIDPRQLLERGKTISPRSDPSTARYLKILVPQRDSRKSGEGGSLSETSPNLFESLSTSAAERLLLESPTDSPSHFRQAQLCLDTADSEAETSILGLDSDAFASSAGTPRQLNFSAPNAPRQQSVAASSTPKQQTFTFSKHSIRGSATTGPSSHALGRQFDFEEDFQRMVSEVYSEKETGSTSGMEGVHPDSAKMSQARSALEKSFGGGDEFVTSHYKPAHHPPTKMAADSFTSLANTSDALALQKSVVGDSSVKPASMDEIAALLESVQKGQYQKDQSLNSLNSTLQSMENNSSINDSIYDKQYNSMSSLDETPSKIPADYVEPGVTPAAMNGVDPSVHAPSASEPKLGNVTPEPSEGQQQMEKQGKKVKTVQKRPTSLLAQNTTLAISSAIAHKYHVHPQDEVVSPTSMSAPIEPMLYRSPVEAITTSKGGHIASMEGQEKVKPKKKKGKKGGRKSAMATSKLVSDTDTEPPSDTESIPRKSFAEMTDGSGSRLHELSEGGSLNQEEIVSPVIAESIHESSVPVESSAPPPHDIESPIHKHQNGEEPLATLPPASTTVPSLPPESEPVPTSAPEVTPVQSAVETSTPSSGSFLGSLFPWGRRAEKPAAPSSTAEKLVPCNSVSPSSTLTSDASQSTNQAAANGPLSQDESRRGVSKDQDNYSDSIDSGVDIVPLLNGEGSVGSDLVSRPEPISSSTPTVARSTGRRDENVPHQARPPYSHPSPTAAPVQQTSQTNPKDMGRTRYNPASRMSGNQSSRYMPPVGGRDGNDEELQSVLREKAKLEGQLEMLMSESESALQARTQLQSQVAILQAKLKARGSGGDGSSHDRTALETEISSLKNNRGRLEQTISHLQVEIDAKEADLEGLRRELQISEITNRKIQAKLDEVKREIGNREGTITQLKDKMAAMQGQVDQARQEQATSVAKVSTLETDVESLTKARDWFKEQLDFAQDVRSQLQGELSSVQSKAATQASAIETLKTENTKVKQQLTEARQRMLQEKEQIAKHLETIEADIMTREATFSAMQREKTAVQQAVFSQMDQMEEEKYRLASLVASASELERQLDVARQELEAKHAALVGLETEKRDLVKGLALAEESLAARTTEMEALQVKCNNVEEKLREEQGRSHGQDDEVLQLKSDKASLEAALATANEEKRGFDESLQKLRGDLSRVDTGFKQMRQELGVKTSQLEETEMEGQQLKEQLKDQEKQLDMQQANLEASIAAISNKDAIIDDLVRVKSQLEQEIGALKQDVLGAKSSYEGSVAANTELHAELSKAREGFSMLEQQLQETLAENANLQGRLESLSEDHKQFAELMDENAGLRQRVADTQSTMHREMAEQKASALRLGSDLSNVQRELREKEQVYTATIQALTRQLEDASVERDRVEKELCERTEAVAQMSKEEQEKMLGELQGIKQDADLLRAERNRLNAEVQHLRKNLTDETDKYRKQVDELEAELQELREALDQQRRNELNNRSLALDLERERGRLAGVHQSHSALKQHTGMLESALAQRETAVAELTDELNASSQDKINENMRLQKQLRETSSALEKEKELAQEVRKQLANEKGNNSQLRQDLQTLSLDTQEVKGQMKQKDHQIAVLHAELARLKQNEEQERGERDAVRRELEASKGQMETLKRQLLDRDAQGPVLQDQMKTLAWQSEQKARQADSLKEQLELAEKRQQIELDGVKSNLQMTNHELEGVKKELGTTRKEKFAYQAKMNQLKSALQATLQQNKLLKAKLKSKSRVAATLGKHPSGSDGTAQAEGKAEEIVVPEIAYDVESLLNSDVVEGVSASHSRPLHAIQSCLQSIKDQMGALEDQMKEHTAAVNSSSEAWKEVGDKVHALRKASADPIAPSASLQLSQSPMSNGSGLEVSSPPRQGQGRTDNPKTRSSRQSAKQPMIYDL